MEQRRNEVNNGLARDFGIHRWSFNNSWTYTSGLASLQAQERAGNKSDIHLAIFTRCCFLALVWRCAEFTIGNLMEWRILMSYVCNDICKDQVRQLSWCAMPSINQLTTSYFRRISVVFWCRLGQYYAQ